MGGLGDAFAGMRLPDLPAGAAGTAPGKGGERLWKMGRVVLRKEKAHRGGKRVIVVDDFATHLPVSVIETMARKLRAGCGCGGTVKERRIEVQGGPGREGAVDSGSGRVRGGGGEMKATEIRVHWPDLDEDIGAEGVLAGRASGESPRSFQAWLESRLGSGNPKSE